MWAAFPEKRTCRCWPRLPRTLIGRTEFSSLWSAMGPYLTELREKMRESPAPSPAYLEGEDIGEGLRFLRPLCFPQHPPTRSAMWCWSQASGLPVVVTDAGGPHENIVPESPARVDAHSTESLLSAIHCSSAVLRPCGRWAGARQVVEERSFERLSMRPGALSAREGTGISPDQAV